MKEFDPRLQRIAAVIVLLLAVATLAIGSAQAEQSKDVNVVNTPAVQAQQMGPWSVSVLGDLKLAPGALVGIDPAQNLVRTAPPVLQPFQRSTSLFIDYPDDTWQWNITVPDGKLLIIEYVSGEFTKTIGGGTDPSQPPFLFTVTTNAGGSTASHVVPVRGIYDYAGAKSWFQIAEPLRLYADGGSTVTVTLHHLFSSGYREQGSVSLAGQLQDTP